MSTALILNVLITVFTTVSIAAVAWWALGSTPTGPRSTRNGFACPRCCRFSAGSACPWDSSWACSHLFAYSDIGHYTVGTLKGQQFLTVKSVHGVKLSLNMSAYDMTPLLRAIDFRDVTGRWPVRPGATAQDI